jgi:putative hydrolase of the HAD superfamily
MGLVLEVDTVFFDWGGTLADVRREARWWRECADEAVRHLMPADSADDRHRVTAESLWERFRGALEAAGKDPALREIDSRAVLIEWGRQSGLGPAEAWPIDEVLQAFWRRWVGVLDVFEGAAETVAELKRRGYRLGLVSNCATPEPFAIEEVRRQGLAGYFDGLVFSSAVGYRKPHPAIYEAAIRAVCNGRGEADPRRMLFVGDGPVYDVAEPQRRGMRTVMVRYSGLPWPAEQVNGVTPDLRVDHVREILAALPTKR